jgi:iron complex outermembrane receptor protein
MIHAVHTNPPRHWGLSLLVTLILPLGLLAQGISLTGRIVSQTTQSPIPYANVVEASGVGTFASATGRFRLEVDGLPATLRITRVGFADTVIVADREHLGEIYLFPTVLSGEEVLVSATRAIEGQSPVAFTTLDRDEIERAYSHQDIPMVLAGEPGVYAYSDAGNGVGYTYLKVRGFSQDRVGVYLNGIPLNDPEAHAVYWVDHGDMLAAASDIQIQRGVGNSLYGTSVFGGTINLTTNLHAQPAGFTLKGGYGNYTEKGLDLPSRKYSLSYAGGPWRRQGWTLYGRFSDLASEGYRTGSGTIQRAFHAGVENSRANTLTRLEAMWGHEETAFSWEGIIPLYGYDLDNLVDRRYNYYADPTWNGGLDDANKDVFTQSIISFQHSRKIGAGLLNMVLYTVKGDGYYEQFKGGRDVEEYNLLPNLPDTVGEVDLLRRKWLRNGYTGGISHYTYPFSLGTVTLGGDVRFYSADHYGRVLDLVGLDFAIPSDHRYYNNDTRKTSFSAYLHSIINLTPRLSVMADLRYLGHRYSFEQEVMGAFTEGYDFKLKYDFIDPHFGINYMINDEVSLFANVSTGHREPADRDIYDHDDPGTTPVVENMDSDYAKPLVNEEYLIDYEAGLSFDWSVIGGKINLYYMDFRNELIPVYYRYFDADDVLRGNAARTLHQGLEIYLTIEPLSWLLLQGSLSYADNRFVEFFGDALGWSGGGGIADYSDKEIPAYPRLQVKENAIATHRFGETWLQLSYIGDQFIDFANTEAVSIEPYTLIHFGTRFDLPQWDSVQSALIFRVDNVFDKLYETFGYTYYDGWPPYRVDAYWPGATRSYFVELHVHI